MGAAGAGAFRVDSRSTGTTATTAIAMENHFTAASAGPGRRANGFALKIDSRKRRILYRQVNHHGLKTPEASSQAAAVLCGCRVSSSSPTLPIKSAGLNGFAMQPKPPPAPSVPDIRRTGIRGSSRKI